MQGSRISFYLLCFASKRTLFALQCHLSAVFSLKSRIPPHSFSLPCHLYSAGVIYGSCIRLGGEIFCRADVSILPDLVDIFSFFLLSLFSFFCYSLHLSSGKINRKYATRKYPKGKCRFGNAGQCERASHPLDNQEIKLVL